MYISVSVSMCEYVRVHGRARVCLCASVVDRVLFDLNVHFNKYSVHIHVAVISVAPRRRAVIDIHHSFHSFPSRRPPACSRVVGLCVGRVPAWRDAAASLVCPSPR